MAERFNRWKYQTSTALPTIQIRLHLIKSLNTDQWNEIRIESFIHQTVDGSDLVLVLLPLIDLKTMYKISRLNTMHFQSDSILHRMKYWNEWIVEIISFDCIYVFVVLANEWFTKMKMNWLFAGLCTNAPLHIVSTWTQPIPFALNISLNSIICYMHCLPQTWKQCIDQLKLDSVEKCWNCLTSNIYRMRDWY